MLRSMNHKHVLLPLYHDVGEKGLLKIKSTALHTLESSQWAPVWVTKEKWPIYVWSEAFECSLFFDSFAPFFVGEFAPFEVRFKNK